MTAVFIIEDEIKTARYLSNLVAAARDFSVVGTSGSVKSAVVWLKDHKADLILSDVQLADGLSFEIFRQHPPGCPVIFCTAFDQYAINAFEVNGIDYLLKPIDPEKLYQSLEKFRSMRQLFVGADGFEGRLNAVLNGVTKTYKTTLLVHHRERIIPLKLSEVHYARSENGVLTLYTQHTRYTVSHTLEELEAMLNPEMFFQVNRQFIVNRHVILGAEQYFSRRLLLQLTGATQPEIVVSKARVQAFLVWLRA